jgi:hypothetical protein
MELALSMVALACFIAMIVAWAVVPHRGRDLPDAGPAPEPGAAHALGVN